MSSSTSLFFRFTAWWEAEIVNRPWWVLLLTLSATAYCGFYTFEHLTVDTDTADMISIELPFQQNRLRLERAFPQDVSTILLVVEGESPEQTSRAVDFLGEHIQKENQYVKSVYIPGSGDFFAKNGLMYQDLPELEKLSSDLANAQPFIGRIATQPGLDGFFNLLSDAIKMTGDDLPMALGPLLDKMNVGIDHYLAGQPYQVSWQQLMMDQKPGFGVTQRFIIITPTLDFNAMLPAEQAINAIKTVATQAQDGRFGALTLRMTGEVVLEHEEMDSITQGTATASIASMILVFVTLLIGYRSPKLVIATLLTLAIGLVFSLYFATVAIGHLNLISVGFAVLFIGMGDAYSSHFCLRYRELLQRGDTQRQALLGTLNSTGSALILCTFTAAIGLFAFLPTNYVGVSELGIIAGVSMFIALITTFTLLPALLKLMPLRPVHTWQPEDHKFLGALLGNWPLRYAKPIRILTYITAVIALGLLTRVEVDFNPINLRDPNSESVKTFKYLLKSQDTSPMTLASLARNETEVREKSAAFEKLSSVDRVVSLFDFIPKDQDEKRDLIEEMSLVLGQQLDKFPSRIDAQPKPASIRQLMYAIEISLKKRHTDAERASLSAFLERLRILNDRLMGLSPADQARFLFKLQDSLLGTLPYSIARLRDSLNPGIITLQNLPEDLRTRWLSQDGWYRLQIFSQKDLNDLDTMRSFIHDAQTVDSNVTDLPVTFLESMNEVVLAFKQAFSIALVAIAVLLAVVLRNLRDTLLVMLPLVLAGIYTAACTVLFHVPFNFANIIALPLLFGLGVDSGIHMAHRLHYLHTEAGDDNLLTTSEAQGVFYSALTTVFSFMSLAFTPHAGTASMGALLAIGLMLTLICALVVLPAFSTLGRPPLKFATPNAAEPPPEPTPAMPELKPAVALAPIQPEPELPSPIEAETIVTPAAQPQALPVQLKLEPAPTPVSPAEPQPPAIVTAPPPPAAARPAAAKPKPAVANNVAKPNAASAQPSVSPRLCGMILTTEARKVMGWAIGADPLQPIAVLLRVNGQEVEVTLANKFRPGLKQRGHPTGNCGFAFDLEARAALKPGDEIEVMPLDQSFGVVNSPMRFTPASKNT